MWQRAWVVYRSDAGNLYRVYAPNWVLDPGYASHVGASAAAMTLPRLPGNMRMRRQVWHRDSDAYRWSVPCYNTTIKFWPLPGGSETLPNPDAPASFSSWHIVSYVGERIVGNGRVE